MQVFNMLNLVFTFIMFFDIFFNFFFPRMKGFPRLRKNGLKNCHTKIISAKEKKKFFKSIIITLIRERRGWQSKVYSKNWSFTICLFHSVNNGCVVRNKKYNNCIIESILCNSWGCKNTRFAPTVAGVPLLLKKWNERISKYENQFSAAKEEKKTRNQLQF